MSWSKEVIQAFLMDDPSKDVDPKRASRLSEVAMRKAFSIKGSLTTNKRSLTSWSKRLENAEYDLVLLFFQMTLLSVLIAISLSLCTSIIKTKNYSS